MGREAVVGLRQRNEQRSGARPDRFRRWQRAGPLRGRLLHRGRRGRRPPHREMGWDELVGRRGRNAVDSDTVLNDKTMGEHKTPGANPIFYALLSDGQSLFTFKKPP